MAKITVYDAAVGVLKRTKHTNYLYISNKVENLESVYQHCLNSVDLSSTSTKIYFVLPQGLSSISSLDHLAGVWIDDGALSEEDYDNFVKPYNGGWLEMIDPTTQEIL